MTRADWWRGSIVSVPPPIPKGYMVGMRGEVRDGKHYVVEFLERVPEYQPNPFSRGRNIEPEREAKSKSLCIDFERDGRVLFSWSRARGFTIYSQ